MKPGCALFDWGDTLMVDFPDSTGPMASWPRVEAVTHARETIEELHGRGWRLAVATNAADSDEAAIREALARVGIDELIERVYCARSVGYSKPSRQFFEFIERDLGLAASELVMVGDSYEIDIAGANRCGIRGVLLDRRDDSIPRGESCRCVRDLEELPDLLESWL